MYYNAPVGSACRVFSSSLSFLKLVNLTNSAPHRWLSKCCFRNILTNFHTELSYPTRTL